MDRAELLVLKRQKADGLAKPQTGDTMSQTMQPVILAIDPDETSLALIATLLESRNMQVRCATRSEDAIDFAANSIVDLVICEMQVNQSSGLEIASQIHGLEQRHDVPFLFVSAFQTPDIILRRHQSGSAFHVKKPFDHNIFVEIVERALWMPHLISSHFEALHSRESLAQPHFPMGSPGVPSSVVNVLPTSSPNNASGLH